MYNALQSLCNAHSATYANRDKMGQRIETGRERRGMKNREGGGRERDIMKDLEGKLSENHSNCFVHPSLPSKYKRASIYKLWFPSHHPLAVKIIRNIPLA